MRPLLLMLLSLKAFALTESEIVSIASYSTAHPKTILAICKVESSMGKRKVGDHGKSLGIAQMQIRTLRFLSCKNKELGFIKNLNDKAIAVLLMNDRFSVTMASKYFTYLTCKYGYKTAIQKYNGGFINKRYLAKVEGAMQ